jgi:hypothetical protein
MELHAVESGAERVLRGPSVIGHDLANLNRGEGPGSRVRRRRSVRERALARLGHLGRGIWRPAIGLVGVVGDAPHVPELREDPPAPLVHRTRHQLPTLDLGVGVKPRRRGVSRSARRDLRRLADDQPRRRPLGVVLGVQRVRNIAGARAAPGERRHEHSVGERVRADADRRENIDAHRSIVAPPPPALLDRRAAKRKRAARQRAAPLSSLIGRHPAQARALAVMSCAVHTSGQAGLPAVPEDRVPVSVVPMMCVVPAADVTPLSRPAGVSVVVDQVRAVAPVRQTRSPTSRSRACPSAGRARDVQPAPRSNVAAELPAGEVSGTLKSVVRLLLLPLAAGTREPTRSS